MKIIYNDYIPVEGFGSMTFLCWMFRRRDAGAPSARSFRHESIHSRQHFELFGLSLVLGGVFGWACDFSWWGWLLWIIGSLFSYYVLYVILWVVEIVRPPYSTAYRDICFEVEAYSHEDDEDYLRRRIPFLGWVVCLYDKELREVSRAARRGFVKK